MSCWTLWQRMPPRYQLTMRDIRKDEPESPRPKDARGSSRASSASPRGCKLRVSRSSQRVGSASARLTGDGVMLTSRGAETSAAEAATATTTTAGAPAVASDEFGRQSPALPSRSSAYIHNMKNTMRINSAKRKMDEGTFVPTAASAKTQSSTVSYTPTARANTAPPFPITKPSNTDEYHRVNSPAPQPPEPHVSSNSPRRHQDIAAIVSPRHYLQGVGCSPRQQQGGLVSPRHKGHHHQQQQQRGFSGRLSPRRPSSGYARGDTRRVAVSTIAPFSETGQFRAEGQRPLIHHGLTSGDRLQQDCVIGDCQVATLYVDKGRVTFFRKTRPDLTQSVYSAMNPYQASKDDGSYLAHLRKAYLTGVRDLPKTCHKSEPDMQKHTTIRQRLDYDKKVGKILDYYAQVDISKQAHSPRPPAVTSAEASAYSRNPLRSGFKTITFRRSRATRSSLGGAEESSEGLECHSPRNHHPSQQHRRRPQSRRGSAPLSRERPQEAADEREEEEGDDFVPPIGGFVRINSKARLHDRQNFYLRTPGIGGPAGQSGNGSDSCVCGLCKLEMDVALMAQLHKDLGVSVDAATAAQIRAALEAKDAVVEDHSAAHATAAAAATPNNITTSSPQNATNYIDLRERAGLNAVQEEAFCPTRPNSVSDTAKRSTGEHTECTPPARETNVRPKAQESTVQVNGKPERQEVTNTRASPDNEPTCLTVTMPTVEETGEATPVAKSTNSDAVDIADGSGKEMGEPHTLAHTIGGNSRQMDSEITNAGTDTFSTDVTDDKENDGDLPVPDSNQANVSPVDEEMMNTAESSNQNSQAPDHAVTADTTDTQQSISDESKSEPIQDNPECIESGPNPNQQELPECGHSSPTENNSVSDLNTSIQSCNNPTTEGNSESTPAHDLNGMTTAEGSDRGQVDNDDEVQTDNNRSSDTTATAPTTTIDTIANDDINSLKEKISDVPSPPVIVVSECPDIEQNPSDGAGDKESKTA